jgi:regulator of cell morphogenesis and NO signaling
MKGLHTDTIVNEIQKELKKPDSDVSHWDQAKLDDLIDHILAAYHRPLAEELPRLVTMAQRVLRAHKDKAPDVLPELAEVILGLRTELEQHMAKEEQILFPMIRQGQGGIADGPIAMMHREHESAGSALKRLRELTDDYDVPDCACNTWRALWHGLAALEESLHQHIHLENNILFPRTLLEHKQ